MRRRSFIFSLIAATLGGSIDLAACGDKFLRVGRSARFRRYAAMYPSTILIYTPANATRAGIEELQGFLKRAGHRPVVIDRGANISAALSLSPYDVVIADYYDAERISSALQRSDSHPALLPILNDPSKAAENEATRQYVHLIRPQAMTKFDALTEIDRLMQTRSRPAAAK